MFTTNVDGPGNSDVPVGRPVDVDGVLVTYFPSTMLRRLYWSPPMGRALAAQTASFDLVHVHAIYLWPTLAGARAARKHGRPYVLSPRGMLVPELIRRRSRWVKNAWIALFDRHNLEAAAAIHTTSAVEAEHLRSFGWSLPQVATIPHGVDDPEATEGLAVSPDVAAVIAKGPAVLALGRISWEKGFDRLIAALPLATEAHVVIAGGDADGQAAHLTNMARRLGVLDRVTILPRFIDGADKEALFAAASVFAMTSLSENFGLAAFEAMRRGVPVLATPNVGMAEIVREIGSGVVVDPSPNGIAHGLNTLLADPAASRRMGNVGRDHVVAHYGWQAVAKMMEDLYLTVLASRSTKAGMA